MEALKKCLTGGITKETTSEYVRDDEGNMVLTKQKVLEKTIPPNPDLMKLLYQKVNDITPEYENLSDEDLKKEKQRLLSLLKEENDAD